MASGGWFAGLLYDHFGYYAPAFAAGLIFNVVNLLLIGTLVMRRGGWFGGSRPAPPTDNDGRTLERCAQRTPETIASATLTVETPGEGFIDITRDVADFLQQAGAQDGVLLAYIRHTSASLVIQENADPDVQTDLVTALSRLAPANAGWVHDTEGPDDMPAHVKAMLNGVSLHVPVIGGKLALGTWQGIYRRGAPRAAAPARSAASIIGSQRLLR